MRRSDPERASAANASVRSGDCGCLMALDGSWTVAPEAASYGRCLRKPSVARTATATQLTLMLLGAEVASARRRQAIVLGHGRYRIAPHHKATLTIRLNRTGRELLRRRHIIRPAALDRSQRPTTIKRDEAAHQARVLV